MGIIGYVFLCKYFVKNIPNNGQIKQVSDMSSDINQLSVYEPTAAGLSMIHDDPLIKWPKIYANQSLPVVFPSETNGYPQATSEKTNVAKTRSRTRGRKTFTTWARHWVAAFGFSMYGNDWNKNLVFASSFCILLHSILIWRARPRKDAPWDMWKPRESKGLSDLGGKWWEKTGHFRCRIPGVHLTWLWNDLLDNYIYNII